MDSHRKTILACIDGSTYSDSVVDHAVWMAGRVDAPLKLLHNIEHRDSPVPTDLSGNLGLDGREELLRELVELDARRSKLLIEQGKAMLEHARNRALAGGGQEPERVQRHGTLADSLIDMEEEIRLLVVGVRGEGHDNQEDRIGAQLESIIRAMHRPVLVVNRPFEAAPEKVMIAYDGSEASRKGLDMVTLSPFYRGLECHLVHVGTDSRPDEAMMEEAAHILKQAGLNVVSASLRGDAEKALLDYQSENGIGMVVMGAFGHSRIRELLFGSFTSRMIAHSRVPLLLLR